MNTEEVEDGIFDNIEETTFKDNEILRQKLIAKIMNEDKNYFSPGLMAVVVSALDSSDGTILKKAKVKATNELSKSNNNVAEVAANILKSIKPKELETRSDNVILTAPSSLIPTDIVEGETDVGTVAIDHDKFVE